MAAPAPGDETQPAVAPVVVTEPSFIQPWMIVAIVAVVGLLVLAVVVLLVVVLRNRRRSAW